MNIATEAHRNRLTRLATYIATAKTLATFSWKAIKTQFVLVNNVSANPLTDAVQLVVVGQVSHGVSNLEPLGNYNSQFDNMNRAKITFELQLPSDNAFSADYYRAVSVLRKFQKDAAKTSDVRNLLVDSSMHSGIKLSAPLFRTKLNEYDTELLPEGNISDDPLDPDYFPTSSNWPVSMGASLAFADAVDNHVFEPLHVFTATGRRISPNQFSTRLPGALVEVHFSLHHWHFNKDHFDSFNAHAKQVIIIKDAAHQEKPQVPKKAIRGISRPDDWKNPGGSSSSVYGTKREGDAADEVPTVKKPRIDNISDSIPATQQDTAVIPSTSMGQASSSKSVAGDIGVESDSSTITDTSVLEAAPEDDIVCADKQAQTRLAENSKGNDGAPASKTRGKGKAHK